MKDLLASLHHELSELALACGRDPEEVKLLPVSKTKPMNLLLEAYQAGERVFGENRIAEACEKRQKLPDDAEIDFIGHIQTNKVSRTLGQFRLIHSVDSLKLAQKLNKLNEDAGKVQKILLELNCSGEESKSGYCDENMLNRDLEKILSLKHIQVRGFMTMAPWVSDERVLRGCFSRCREIRDRAEERFGFSLPELSMGMTNDYPYAVQEGSTIIRIGTAIFGNRIVK